MHVPDLHEYGTPESEAAAKAVLSDERRKQIREAVAAIIDEEFYRIEEYAGEFLCSTATARAEVFLERVLKGDSEASKALLGGDRDRYRTMGYDEGKPWARLIHGKLFETSGIQLRREIVEANRDLITAARIKDLESIVDGLSQQVRSLEADLERCRQR